MRVVLLSRRVITDPLGIFPVVVETLAKRSIPQDDNTGLVGERLP